MFMGSLPVKLLTGCIAVVNFGTLGAAFEFGDEAGGTAVGALAGIFRGDFREGAITGGADVDAVIWGREELVGSLGVALLGYFRGVFRSKIIKSFDHLFDGEDWVISATAEI